MTTTIVACVAREGGGTRPASVGEDPIVWEVYDQADPLEPVMLGSFPTLTSAQEAFPLAEVAAPAQEG